MFDGLLADSHQELADDYMRHEDTMAQLDQQTQQTESDLAQLHATDPSQMAPFGPPAQIDGTPTYTPSEPSPEPTPTEARGGPDTMGPQTPPPGAYGPAGALGPMGVEPTPPTPPIGAAGSPGPTGPADITAQPEPPPDYGGGAAGDALGALPGTIAASANEPLIPSAPPEAQMRPGYVAPGSTAPELVRDQFQKAEDTPGISGANQTLGQGYQEYLKMLTGQEPPNPVTPLDALETAAQMSLGNPESEAMRAAVAGAPTLADTARGAGAAIADRLAPKLPEGVRPGGQPFYSGIPPEGAPDDLARQVAALRAEHAEQEARLAAENQRIATGGMPGPEPLSDVMDRAIAAGARPPGRPIELPPGIADVNAGRAAPVGYLGMTPEEIPALTHEAKAASIQSDLAQLTTQHNLLQSQLDNPNLTDQAEAFIHQRLGPIDRQIAARQAGVSPEDEIVARVRQQMAAQMGHDPLPKMPPLRSEKDQVLLAAQARGTDQFAPLYAAVSDAAGAAGPTAAERSIALASGGRVPAVAWTLDADPFIQMANKAPPALMTNFDSAIAILRDSEVAAKYAANPDRLYASGITDVDQGLRAFGALQNTMSPQDWTTVLHMAKAYREGAARTLDRLVADSIVDPDIAEYLQQTQPYYSRTRYLEAQKIIQDAGGIARTANGDFAVAPSVLQRLSEYGHEGERLRPDLTYVNSLADAVDAGLQNRAKLNWTDQMLQHPDITMRPALQPRQELVTGIARDVDFPGGMDWSKTAPPFLDQQAVQANGQLATIARTYWGDPAKGEYALLRGGKVEVYQLPNDKLIRDAFRDLSPHQLGLLGEAVRLANEPLREGATYLSAPFSPRMVVRNTAALAARDPRAAVEQPKTWAQLFVPIMTGHPERVPEVYKDLIQAGMGDWGTSSLTGTPLDSPGFFTFLQHVTGKNTAPTEFERGLQYLARTQHDPQFLSIVRHNGGIVADSPSAVAAALAKAYGWDAAFSAGAGGIAGSSSYAADPNMDPMARAGLIAGAMGAGAFYRTGASRFAGLNELVPRATVGRVAMGRGASVEDAAFQARRALIDWQRQGSLFRTLGPFVPFIGVESQVALQLPRLIRDKPANALNALAMLAAGAVGASAWNHRDDQAAARWDDIQDSEKRAGVVLTFGDAVPNENGVGFKTNPHILLPLGPLQLLYKPWADLADRLYQQDKSQFMAEYGGDLAGDIKGALPSSIENSYAPGLSSLPAVAKVPYELASNKSLYSGAPIESRKAQEQPVPKRIAPYTSELAKNAPPLFGMSPIQKDFALREATGGLGGTVATGLSNAASGRPDEGPTIPVASGFLSGIVKNYGGATLQHAYMHADQLYSQNVDHMISNVEGSPEYRQAPDQQARDQMMADADRALRAWSQEQAGVPKPLPSGPPARGDTPRESQEITRVLNKGNAFLHSPGTAPELTDPEWELYQTWKGSPFNPERAIWLQEERQRSGAARQAAVSGVR